MLNHDRREAAPHDPAHDERVVSLLEAAAAPTEPGPVPGEVGALAAFVASRENNRRSPVLASLATAKMAVVASLSGLLLTGGIGAAVASGSLPGAAQDTASDWLSKVGVAVPGADGRAAGHAGDRGASDDEIAGDENSDDTGERSGEGKGAEVSPLARDTELSGSDKGAAVSELASDGRSRAGEHGKSGEKDEKGEKASAAKQDNAREADDADETEGGSDASGDANRATSSDHAEKGTDGTTAPAPDETAESDDDAPRVADSGERP